MNISEQKFSDVMTARGLSLIPQPKRFNLNNTTYLPDFYCVEEDCYYEVSGTRQAFHANKKKYEALMALYPDVKFKIVRPDGTGYEKINIKSIPLKIIRISKYKCTRCGHEWIPRRSRRPGVCPVCKRRDWDVPRIVREKIRANEHAL